MSAVSTRTFQLCPLGRQAKHGHLSVGQAFNTCGPVGSAVLQPRSQGELEELGGDLIVLAVGCVRLYCDRTLFERLYEFLWGRPTLHLLEPGTQQPAHAHAERREG
jgi:hypothetical protein